MERVEIFKNNAEIQIRVGRCPAVRTTVQSLYDKLNSNGLVTSFDSVIETATKFVFDTRARDGQGHLTFDSKKKCDRTAEKYAHRQYPGNRNLNGFQNEAGENLRFNGNSRFRHSGIFVVN